ncbi:DNA-binding protein HU-beta/DNA-binding protein HU-alpha [Anaerovirgula multivorans]|uniref:DNA-binding protein HU-beta/DNA-binding protein HU-alpha n=1 Tax=Anaerovirgula multivorans TaxID=312168 RepID=A0A239CKQ3_9FIRM|nr:HU family DNA-binding protein [Anaerovirgula multivorans]SNS20737.1 DNA-binding protein HU-beta/DNA-binding protein HU-alpha [Anaerovirgula multivorans]
MKIHSEGLKKLYAEKYGISEAEAMRRLKEVASVVTSCLENGNDVMFPEFFNFKIRERKAKEGRNPSTGKPMTIPSTKTVVASMSASTKRKVKGIGSSV